MCCCKGRAREGVILKGIESYVSLDHRINYFNRLTNV